MTPFNNEEYNRMCAEFMGFKVIPCGTIPIGKIKHPEISEAFLKYDTDWNWIMEVVDKINDPKNGIMMSLHPNSCMITDNGRRGHLSLNSISTMVRVIDTKDRKEAAVLAIWEYLNEYKNN